MGDVILVNLPGLRDDDLRREAPGSDHHFVD